MVTRRRRVLSLIALMLIPVGLATLSAQSGPRQVSLIITNGTVVTMDGERRVLQDAAVAVDGMNIVAVDSAAAIRRRFRGHETIDAGGQVIMPGLINTHTHAAAALLRGLVSDLPAAEARSNYLTPVESGLVSPAFVRAGTRLAALEMIESGTTTFADMYYFEDDVARETSAAGLRAVLGQTITQAPAVDAQTPADALARADAFITAFAKDPLITPAVAPQAIGALDGPTLKAARDLSRRHGVPTLIHLAETHDELQTAQERFRSSPVAYLDSLGFLGPGVVAAGGVWASDADIALLASRGVAIAHTPESNMALASGTAPVTAYVRAGVAVGLGTDGAAGGADLDMFESMRTASLLQKVQTVDARAVPTATALAMATIGGARALGLDKLTGSIEVGKRADIIVVDTSTARQSPGYDPIVALVRATHGSDVQATVVQGRVLMRNRKLVTLDAAAILEEARHWAGKVKTFLASAQSSSAPIYGRLRNRSAWSSP